MREKDRKSGDSEKTVTRFGRRVKEVVRYES